jgi:hypothetical protein
MSYLSVQDFRQGMDRRRERVAGVLGSLWTLENGHITRGGDIERCKRFSPRYALPAGTFGMVMARRQLYAFGSDNLASRMPVGVAYQRLEAPSGAAMTMVLDATAFAGRLYVVAEYADGSTYHFFDGQRVTDWDACAAASADFESLAALLATKISSDAAVTADFSGNVIRILARVPGVPFTASVATVNGGSTDSQVIMLSTVQSNVVAVAESRATTTLAVLGGADLGRLTALTIGGVSLLAVPVPWLATNEATAIRISQQINNLASVTGFSASVTGAVVTITAAVGTGAAPNGAAVYAVTSGGFQVSVTPTVSGGVSAVDAVPQVVEATFGGLFEVADQFVISINGTDYRATGLAAGMGRSAKVLYKRIWSPIGPLWRYSMLNRPDIVNPANNSTDNDSGFLNVARETEGGENLVGAGKYQGLVGAWSEQSIVIYKLDVDPNNFAVDTIVDNSGTLAPRAIVCFGNTDTFYPDHTGIRSLQARTVSNAPFVSDVGNAIDTFFQAYAATLTERQIRAAVGAIEPRDGRYMLAVGDRVFVLSFFPGAKISAWSYYSPGFQITDFARNGNKLYARAGDTIYLYGGEFGDEYPNDDELPVKVETPFMSANDPAAIKMLEGFDMAATNEWEVRVSMDANRPDKMMRVGKVKDITFNDGDIKLPGRGALFALTLTCKRKGRATISMQQVHFAKTKPA